ncbi:MAG: hypothetical protein IT435_13395 [Phycisphaerales bacterium]|nr:hypothetical protein [Phycisphaerales bacterium]
MSPQVQQLTIPAEGKAAVVSLRRTFADVLASVGADITQPQEISRRFGLDKTLTWRIARLVREEDAGEAISHMPRKPSVKIFVKMMARYGASAGRLDELLHGIDEFERFVEGYSGDRETLDAMIHGAAKRVAAEKRMEAFRKGGFQSNCAVWGIRARVHLSISVLVPGSEPGLLSAGIVCGLIDLFRLRADVPWAVASAVAWDSAGLPAADRLGTPLPLHPEGLFNGVPLLPQFCSQPTPALRTVRVPNGHSRFELEGGPEGTGSASTVLLGWKWPGQLSMYASRPGEIGEHGCHLSTPAELYISDLFVHRSLTFARDPVARVYSEMPGGPRYPSEGREVGLLPMPERVADLGVGPPDTTTPEIRNYTEIFEFAAAAMGFGVNDFQGYRYRLGYPPIPVLAVLQHPLVAAPPTAQA